jgi:hypothetical protein
VLSAHLRLYPRLRRRLCVFVYRYVCFCILIAQRADYCYGFSLLPYSKRDFVHTFDVHCFLPCGSCCSLSFPWLCVAAGLASFLTSFHCIVLVADPSLVCLLPLPFLAACLPSSAARCWLAALGFTTVCHDPLHFLQERVVEAELKFKLQTEALGKCE